MSSARWCSRRVSHDVTDAVLEELRALKIAPRDETLTRVEELGGGVAGGSESSLIRADVIGLAGSNARVLARYPAFMAAAGVIACYGVVDANPILLWVRWRSVPISCRSPRRPWGWSVAH